ncbi:hypothetical protein ACSLBF_03905 [Pseudoalteromonas sp. T1lg65]|uniref:hypothetical protein n=1 Tax=Pseudoalteromonas sp. T1lg65 TaxID=2077101 RepID=UPI003F7A9E3C
MKKQTFTLLLLSCLSYSALANENTRTFLSKKELNNLSTELLEQIERLDATAITVRNQTRTVKWPDYKATALANLNRATSWEELATQVAKLHYGIVNRHSYISFEAPLPNGTTLNVDRWPKMELGYTWPNVSFFDVNSGKAVSKINDQSVHALFENHYNHYCNIANRHGCLRDFTNQLAKGYWFAQSRQPITLSYADGSKQTLSQKQLTTNTNESSKSNQLESACENNYLSPEFTLRYSGEHACLYDNKDAYVLKISHFPAWGTDDDDIYCNRFTTNGMCKEITEIINKANSTPKPNLVIDLQGNRGGSENTPWVAALTQNGFTDNLIQYKNITELKYESLRSRLFYGLEEAETWYQSIMKSSQHTNSPFLPVRGDFCRDGNCSLQKVPSNKLNFHYDTLAIVTDEDCVSSCDDLVWRTKKFAGATVYGQPPSSDGAYASAKGHILLTKSGEVQTVLAGGYSSTPDFGEDKHLITFRVPVVKTVNEHGKLLEGDASVLDVPLEINRSNYNHIKLDNVVRTVDLTSSKN